MAGGRGRRGVHAVQRRPLSVMALCAASGLLFVTAAVSARGDDLRPSGGDLTSLLRERADRVENARSTANDLRAQVEDLSGDVGGSQIEQLQQSVDRLQPVTGLTAVAGPGVRVTLDDVPRSARRSGLDPNLLVVHEQDIQAFVNALWAGGAEAVSLQGQRLISTTGIKCVGNTVLLDGVPYSPPYRIAAVGDVDSMLDTLRTTPETVTFADYGRQLGLGLSVRSAPRIEVPAYSGQVGLRYARPTDTP